MFKVNRVSWVVFVFFVLFSAVNHYASVDTLWIVAAIAMLGVQLLNERK